MNDDFRHLDLLLQLRKGGQLRDAWVQQAQAAYRSTYRREPPPDWPASDGENKEAEHLTGFVPNPGGDDYGS